MNAAQTKKAFLNHFWEAGELLYDTITQQRQGDGGSAIATRGGNKPGSTRGKARTGTTRRGRRASTGTAQPGALS